MRSFYCAQAPSLEKWRDFSRSKTPANFICLLNVPSKQQHFNLTNGNLVYCFHGESFFSDKINLKTVFEPFFPIHKKFRREEKNPHSFQIAGL